MKCRNCSNEVDPRAVICPSCGLHPLKGDKFCQSCGSETFKTDVACVQCGMALKSSSKDWLTTLLLNLFLGLFGVHRFYTGSIGIGVVQLLTGGMCGIWTLVDLIMIITDSYKDGEGNPLDRSKY